MTDLLRKVQRFPIFHGMDKEVLEELLLEPGCSVKKHPATSLIHLKGESCSCAEYVLKGEVTVQLLQESGSIMTISNFERGEMLGSNLVFSSHPIYPMMVFAKSDVELLCLDAPTLLKLCMKSPVFLESYLKEISDRALILSGKISAIALKSIRQAILEFLLVESKLQESFKIALPFTKKEWAERLGVQRPSLSRELSKMREEGLIDYDRKTITLREKGRKNV
ncbi:MAG: Crp/Fnr family transcriptional regulator [Tissierellia bacterium]|nr:Crp/Fnr family transcriptional regulator [Tissierellia bacterium]